MTYPRRLSLVLIFGIAMAFVEAAVVVYLRAIYYPGGFTIFLKEMTDQHTTVEIWRETSTLVMLGTVAFLAGRKGWERVGYFMMLFGIWDIFYYVWLRVVLGWPASFTDWDILFLIPVPWVAPVIAPILVAAFMVIAGLAITRRYGRGNLIHMRVLSWIVALVATGVILYSFVRDSDAIGRHLSPASYGYGLLAAGLTGYGFALWWSMRRRR